MLMSKLPRYKRKIIQFYFQHLTNFNPPSITGVQENIFLTNEEGTYFTKGNFFLDNLCIVYINNQSKNIKLLVKYERLDTYVE